MRAIPTHQGHQPDITTDVCLGLTVVRSCSSTGCRSGGMDDLDLGHLVGGGETKGVIKGPHAVPQTDLDQSRYLVGMMATALSTVLSELVGDVFEGPGERETESGQRHARQVGYGGVVEEMKRKYGTQCIQFLVDVDVDVADAKPGGHVCIPRFQIVEQISERRPRVLDVARGQRLSDQPVKSMTGWFTAPKEGERYSWT